MPGRLAPQPPPGTPQIPANPVAPASIPAAPTQATTPQATPQLPPPLSDVPVGSVAAVSFPPELRSKSFSPAAAFLASNLDAITAAGLDYTDIDKHSVVFNPAKISLQDLQKAHKKGDLFKVAPSVPESDLPQAQGRLSRTVHAVPKDATVAAAAPQPQAQAAAPGPAAPAPAGKVPVDNRLKTARIDASKPKAPLTPNPVPDRLSNRAL